ncbi:hypothetical protein [Sphingobacterium deserti]|uniref:Uncharacterized protein n=1 Tax=Sphingobacterium deserti TaxID=1229276 RepID=A0A0B8T2C9_9SPHI|nr:hypothetical protein [Sphingobacterium deserti]KGE15397.1 hypothetical protein DI53_0770 [Sphingobacterium deserti]
MLLLQVITLRLSAQQFSLPLLLGAGGVYIAEEGFFALQDNSEGITLIKSVPVWKASRHHYHRVCINTATATAIYTIQRPCHSRSPPDDVSKHEVYSLLRNPTDILLLPIAGSANGYIRSFD